MLNSALVRYLYLNLSASQLLDALSGALNTPPAEDRSGQETAGLPTSEDVIADLTGHIFTEYRATADTTQSHLLLVVDPDLTALYAGQSSASTRYELLSAGLAAERDIPLIDLTTAFADAFTRSPEFFTYAADGHWNARGHEIVAGAIADWMIPHICRAEGTN